MKIITRTVWILSIISLFADIASEMLYPIIPIYLKEIGFSIFLIGVLEGIAEFTAGLTKGYFGHMSDKKGLRLPFVKLGYFFSAVSKPMMGLFINPAWIFFARTIDRFGKGLRTAARDALLSENATPETKGRVFGFHRSLDTLGALLGPVIAFAFLTFYPGEYTTIFYLAFIPGLISVALIFLLKEKRKPVSTIHKNNFFSYFKYWNVASGEYRKVVIGLLLFALFNSSDIFLLLKTKEITGSDNITLLAYIFYNLVFAVASYPMGMVADKVGLKFTLSAGILLFAVVYFLFGITGSTLVIFIAFFIYGIYAAATEGIAKALLTNTAHKTNTATAIGFYTSFQSICSLLASIVAGLLWSTFNSSVTFFTTAAGAVAVLIYFKLSVIKRSSNSLL